MKIIKENGLNKLVADEGYVLRDKYDVLEEFTENDESVIHEPYYFEYAYLPDNFTLDMATEAYVEEVKPM